MTAAEPSAAVAAWNRFWFRTGPIHLLCSLRLFYGLWFVAKSMGWVAPLTRLGRWRLFHLPAHTKLVNWPFSGFNMKLWGFDWLPEPSLRQFQAIEMSMAPLGLLLMLGLGTRWVSKILFFVFFYYVAVSQFVYTHHNTVLLLVLTVLAFSPCGDHMSLDAIIRRWRGRQIPAERSLLPLRLLQVFVTILYTSAFVGKLNEGWFHGWVLELVNRPHLDEPTIGQAIVRLVGPLTLSWVTLLVEGSLPILLWIPRLRGIAILMGVMFHGGIDSVMPVTTFSYQMTSLYMVFLDPVPFQTKVAIPGMSLGPRLLRSVVRGLDWLCRLDVVEGPRSLGVSTLEVALRLPILFPVAMFVSLPYRAITALRKLSASTSTA